MAGQKNAKKKPPSHPERFFDLRPIYQSNKQSDFYMGKRKIVAIAAFVDLFCSFFRAIVIPLFFFAKIVSLLLFLIFVDQRRSNHAAKGLDCGFLMMQSDLGSDRYSGRKSTNHFIVGHTHFFFRVGGPSPPRHPGMALLKNKNRRIKHRSSLFVSAVLLML